MQIPFANAVLAASAAARLGWNSSSHGGDSDADESLCPMAKPPDVSKVSVRKAIAVGTALLTLAAASSARYAAHTAVSDRQRRCGSHHRIRNGLQADERCDCGRAAARRCGCDRAWWQDRLPPGLWLAQACRRTGARRIARTCRADDRRHDLRHGVVDEVSRNGDCRHAALRTRQGCSSTIPCRSICLTSTRRTIHSVQRSRFACCSRTLQAKG